MVLVGGGEMEIGKVNGGVKGVGMRRFWCFVLECGIVED